MKLKPLGDRLIVQALEEEETTASGIVLPDTAKGKPQKGKVLAVGDGNWDEDGENLALLGLFLCGVREDDPTRCGLLLLGRLDDQAVAKGLQLHSHTSKSVSRVLALFL